MLPSIKNSKTKKYVKKSNEVKFMSKKLFYQDELQKFQHHAFQIWSIIKFLIPSSCSSCTLLGKIKDGENVLINAYN